MKFKHFIMGMIFSLVSILILMPMDASAASVKYYGEEDNPYGTNFQNVLNAGNKYVYFHQVEYNGGIAENGNPKKMRDWWCYLTIDTSCQQVVAYYNHYTDKNYGPIIFRVYDMDGKYIDLVKTYKFGSGFQYDSQGNYVDDGSICSNVGLQYSFTDLLECNIPVFSTYEQCDNYIATGSYEGLLNPKDVFGTVIDLEVPKDLSMSYIDSSVEYSKFKFTWNQTDENYKLWTTEFMYCIDIDWREQIFMVIPTSDWHRVDNISVGKYSCSTSKLMYSFYCQGDDYDSALEYLGGGIQIEPINAHIYIRNSYYDENTGITHYSNWILVDWSWEKEDCTITYTEVESDISGEPTDNIIYDNYSGETVEFDSSSSSDGLIGFISDGFGLLGENGVIELMKDAVSFVPDVIWEIIVIFISMCALVAIFKFIRG